MNLFRWPGVSVINTASILCHINVSFMSFTMSWNMYFLNYLCQTRLHSRHLVDSSNALFSQSLTLAKVCAFIVSKLLIAHMGFPKLGAAFDPETAQECTQSKPNDVRQAWYVVSLCRPQDTRGIKGWLKLPSHRVIWWSIICHNS